MGQDSIGERIKQKRTELGLSQRELAAKADVTASFVSQVERDQVNPSIDSLRRLAEALDVSVLHFLSDGAQHATQSAPQSSDTLKYDPVVRADSRPKLVLPVSGVSYEMLGTDLARKMEAFCGRLAPGTGNVARRLREPTEEFIFVLCGKLLVGLDMGEHLLGPGDSIYFEGRSLEKLACASETEVTWISVITPPVF